MGELPQWVLDHIATKAAVWGRDGRFNDQSVCNSLIVSLVAEVMRSRLDAIEGEDAENRVHWNDLNETQKRQVKCIFAQTLPPEAFTYELTFDRSSVISRRRI